MTKMLDGWEAMWTPVRTIVRFGVQRRNPASTSESST